MMNFMYQYPPQNPPAKNQICWYISDDGSSVTLLRYVEDQQDKNFLDDGRIFKYNSNYDKYSDPGYLEAVQRSKIFYEAIKIEPNYWPNINEKYWFCRIDRNPAEVALCEFKDSPMLLLLAANGFCFDTNKVHKISKNDDETYIAARLALQQSPYMGFVAEPTINVLKSQSELFPQIKQMLDNIVKFRFHDDEFYYYVEQLQDLLKHTIETDLP